VQVDGVFCLVRTNFSKRRTAEKLSGLIERVTFFNEENGFCVFPGGAGATRKSAIIRYGLLMTLLLESTSAADCDVVHHPALPAPGKTHAASGAARWG
jgi:hypothetical protein